MGGNSIGAGFANRAVQIVGTLVVLGIAGTIGLAVAQSGTEKQVEVNTDEIAKLREATAAIPVMQKDIEYVKEDVRDIKDDVDEIKSGIEEIKQAVK